MKKNKYFRVITATSLCFLFAILIWWRAEWSIVQIVCLMIMLLAGLALLVNNQRNEAFDHAANIPLIGAVVVYIWSDTRSLRGDIISVPLTLYFVWLVVKPYYIKRKKSHGPADDSSESPVELEGKSNG
jgi:CDP-diglyceride synthetase